MTLWWFIYFQILLQDIELFFKDMDGWGTID